MLMNENGGMFMFEYLGVSLNVPKAALSSSLEIELSRKSLPNNSVDLAFGESRLSDVIIFGPENTTLLKPCTLNIPYHLHEKPSMTEIVAKHFIPSEEKWINLPASLITETIEGKKTCRFPLFLWLEMYNSFQKSHFFCLKYLSVSFKIISFVCTA